MTKAKYRLLSEYGNRVIYTNNENEKNSLIEKGFYIDKNWQKPAVPKKRKVAKKDEGKTED